MEASCVAFINSLNVMKDTPNFDMGSPIYRHSTLVSFHFLHTKWLSCIRSKNKSKRGQLLFFGEKKEEKVIKKAGHFKRSRIIFPIEGVGGGGGGNLTTCLITVENKALCKRVWACE